MDRLSLCGTSFSSSRTTGGVPTSTPIPSINDWVSNSESYNVYPRNVDTPDEGSRQLVSDPANTSASPKGWVTNGSTYGNNVWAQNNPTGGTTWQNNYRPNAASGNVFDFPIDLTQDPSTYVDAAITQLFYTVNTMHDLSFLYGFDEAAGNFQDVNYSGQGVGGDGVIANAQDGSGTNNANFATPPDGQHGQMRMYVWTQTTPSRDGDFEQDIVAHEFTHGISNRLTGGPSNTDCLNGGEPGGMGEGWSDTVANLLRIKPGDTRSMDLIMGAYVNGAGIRFYPYSTSTSTNPETYSYLDQQSYQEVHAIGEVWAEVLYEVIWNLIDANGIAADLFSHDLTKGNSIALQIILDGMKLQPCNPTFISARDAIIQAEQNLTGGKNRCAVWQGFAKRGVGVNASFDGTTHTEDYSVPSGC
ncbi:extracellular metallo proteinase 4 [Martensiomyces pterosporus]|nr:extracellular metallo proteinase 4 [Martensiomyces pterosporus]